MSYIDFDTIEVIYRSAFPLEKIGTSRVTGRFSIYRTNVRNSGQILSEFIELKMIIDMQVIK